MKKRKNVRKNSITVTVAILAAIFFSVAVMKYVSTTGEQPLNEDVFIAETTAEAQTTETNSQQATEPYNINKKTGRIIVDPTQKNWNLTVVNMSREMPSGYKPELAEILSTGIYMDKRVVPFYEEMYAAAKEDGIILTPYSGYRSYDRQKRNYNNLTDEYMSRYNITRKKARKKAASVILPPGTSEHNLGLAMDICNTLDAFADSKEYAWLTENAHKYGFILRYTADKTDITGIVDEPWHWRFVGEEYAADIKDSGLCLEEYLELKNIDF